MLKLRSSAVHLLLAAIFATDVCGEPQGNLSVNFHFVPSIHAGTCTPGRTWKPTSIRCTRCLCIFNTFSRCYPERGCSPLAMRSTTPAVSTPVSSPPISSSTTQESTPAILSSSVQASITLQAEGANKKIPTPNKILPASSTTAVGTTKRVTIRTPVPTQSTDVSTTTRAPVSPDSTTKVMFPTESALVITESVRTTETLGDSPNVGVSALSVETSVPNDESISMPIIKFTPAGRVSISTTEATATIKRFPASSSGFTTKGSAQASMYAHDSTAMLGIASTAEDIPVSTAGDTSPLETMHATSSTAVSASTIQNMTAVKSIQTFIKSVTRRARIPPFLLGFSRARTTKFAFKESTPSLVEESLL